MIRRLFTYLSLGLVALIFLVYYNYALAQRRLLGARQTQFSIELINPQIEVNAGDPSRFVWKISAPESFSAASTGIYYSYDSTPSALMKDDSPVAVNYANFTFDYATGEFRLPDTFDLNLTFDKKGIVYFRAYAKVDRDHLWTSEHQLIVK